MPPVPEIFGIARESVEKIQPVADRSITLFDGVAGSRPEGRFAAMTIGCDPTDGQDDHRRHPDARYG